MMRTLEQPRSMLHRLWLGAVCGLAVAAFGSTGRSQEPERPARVFWDLDYEEAKDKYGIEGSVFAIGDPVHETITLHALIGAKLAPPGSSLKTPSVQQFIRGVFWNDDPCASLFSNKRDLSASFGIAWYWDFRKADKEADPKRFKGLSCKLEGRSHFGDLQFFHGMANADGLPASDTLERMIAWAKISYAVAVGESAAAMQLTTLPAPFNSLGATPRALFVAPNDALVPERAIGSFVHVIQDSYARGHTRRTLLPGGRFGAIEQFHSYAHQNHDKHKADDMWQSGGDDIDKIKAAKGGLEALEASTRVLDFYRRKTDWSEVEQYLRTGPWRLADKTLPSGP